MEYYNLFDETAVETAVRSKELDGAWLNISRVESLRSTISRRCSATPSAAASRS